MSTYSSSPSDYSYPSSAGGAPGSSSGIVSQTEINQMLHTLRSHRVNTLTELRRIEKVLASINNIEYCTVMRDAWNHYVGSNFLNELRGLTRQYPFSNELLENSKWRVYNDPTSNRSWNFAWLLLIKMKNDNMITEYATKTAFQPAMWGNVVPDAASAQQLANVLTQEWTNAVDRLLKHWSNSPPVTAEFY
ncbi:hypothetical protein L873DRAFT_1828197 [Choiromyces venosus 120613-1]|uniref:Uncharacterized protein n=1 Tax=Choiromyces venosus 120613-1 TaxID=1336337 RepID=A0A3N4JLB7_9PEZI|nr:hypothetical protein L873DRAFT_1828197 [Choiromyces venosus 120613-1]